MAIFVCCLLIFLSLHSFAQYQKIHEQAIAIDTHNDVFERDHSKDQLAKLLGGNFIRVFKANQNN